MNIRYLLLEARITLRNIRFSVFTIVMPAVLFLIYCGLWAGKGAAYPDGTPVTASLMVSMAGYGAMGAAMSTGAQIAFERGIGWQRQLRLTPLSGIGYMLAKGALAMLMALPCIVIVSILGVIRGVELDAGQWLTATGGLWLAVTPFAVLGIMIGMFASPDSLQPIISGSMMALGLLGGMWIPAAVAPEWMRNIMKVTPTYWLQEVGRSAFAPKATLGVALAVLGGYALLTGLLAARRYVTDAVRV
ncbi:ABC transporter permease [Longispora albida]|uniref:ABC transporter permease n=1 Tax=Longispora albida TaxID=203523 RepID=UPI00035FF50E|nr:ABC transporter permease [Longispora albida]